MRLILKKRILIKLVLLFLFSATVVVYLISKEQKLLKEFKYLLETEVEQALSRNVEIQGISGGIFTPITLRNVKIAYSGSSQGEPILTIEQVKVNKRLWDLFFIRKRILGTLILRVNNTTLYFLGSMGPKIKNQSGKIILNKKEKYLSINLANESYHFAGKITNVYKEPSLDMNLKINSQFTKGEIVVKGTPQLPNVRGTLNLFGLTRVTLNDILRIYKGKILFDNLIIQDKYLIKGKIDLKSKQASITMQSEGEDKIRITFNSVDDFKFLGLVEFKHFKVMNYDIVANFESNLCINKNRNNRFESIKGELKTNTCILNYEPVEDINGAFSYSEDAFLIDYLKFGDNCKLSGFIFSREPKSIDVVVEINNLKVENLARFSSIPEEFNFSSTVTSKIDIKGDLKKPEIKIHLTSREGYFQDIEFESVIVNLEGTYPILKYRDSRVNRTDSHLILEGKVDLRKIKTDNLFEDLVIKSDEETIVWEGWDITKRKAESEVCLRKSGDGVSISYSAYLEDETTSEEGSQDTIELEYEIWGNRSIKMRLREDEEFFGLENKIKF